MINVPIQVRFSENCTCCSAELTCSGYSGNLDFLSIDTENSLSGDGGWTYQTNETNGTLKIAMAGVGTIGGEGVLAWLQFHIPDNASGFIPITLDSVLFDTGEIGTVLTSGGIAVNYPPQIVNLTDFTFCNTQYCFINLDTCITDQNHPPESMSWQVLPMDTHLDVSVVNRVAIFSSPDWSGTCDVDFKVTDPMGESDSIRVKAAVTMPSSVEQSENQIPKRYEMAQNHPNPFNPQTKISFDLPKATDVKISVYNLKGEKVKDLFIGNKSAGHHTVIWDASPYTSGTYLIKIETPEFGKIRRCTLLK